MPAQTFPTGPISIVVPRAPGDAADISERAMGEEISRLLNTPVLVVNRPGGGGTGRALQTTYGSSAAAAARASGTTS